MIKSCTCSHKFQDEKYNGKRVMNKTQKGYRCTVCGKDVVSATTKK